MGESDGYEEEVAFEERRRERFKENQVSVVASVRNTLRYDEKRIY